MFDIIFTFVICTCFAFILITSMDDLGKIIGFEQMGVLGISIFTGGFEISVISRNFAHVK